MKQECALPPEWRCLEGKVRYVVQHSPREYSCSCVKCGGDVHADGDWPDRCRLFVDAHPTLWCRRCGLVAFPNSFGDDKYAKPTPQELEKWRTERVQAEQDRKRSAERALEGLRSSKVWQHYHDQIGREGRAYWTNRGIPESLQNYWKLGWIDEYILNCHDETYLTQSATIPIFGLGWQPVNVKHRLLQAPDNAGKYRYEIHGQPQPSFICNPDISLDGLVYAIEGEIKGMVVWLTLADRDVHMVGLPGCTPSSEAVSQLQQAERVVLVLDPGAEDAARKLAIAIGVKRCRILIPPMKIDDAILAIKPTKQELGRLLNMAEPIGA